MTEQPKVGVSSPNDIIAVFATEAEADAYLAGEPAEANCPDCGLPKPSSNPYCFCRPDPRLSVPEGPMPPAPKPVTWPDGVSEMRFGARASIEIDGDIISLNDGTLSFFPEVARQLSALLLAAADKVEGRG